MNTYNKLFLDTNRHHLKSIENGTLRNINVPEFFKIMTAEFVSTHGIIDQDNFDAVAKLVKDVYQHYDKWLIDNPQTVSA